MKPLHEKLDNAHQFKIFGYKTYRNDRENFYRLKKTFSDYLKSKLEEFGGVRVSQFSLENYHIHIEDMGIDHHKFIKSVTRKIPHEVLDLQFIDDLIQIANKDLESNFRIYKSNIEFRVVRPSLSDNNERHRDHWFPYFLPLVNIYVPLAGSYYNSAMEIVPFSHDWPEEDVVPTFTYEESAAGKKFIKNGIQYSVPAVETCSREIEAHTPDLTEGDFMLFSPKLIHGGGGNGGTQTRFSFEIRLEHVDE